MRAIILLRSEIQQRESLSSVFVSSGDKVKAKQKDTSSEPRRRIGNLKTVPPTHEFVYVINCEMKLILYYEFLSGFVRSRRVATSLRCLRQAPLIDVSGCAMLWSYAHSGVGDIRQV